MRVWWDTEQCLSEVLVADLRWMSETCLVCSECVLGDAVGLCVVSTLLSECRSCVDVPKAIDFACTAELLHEPAVCPDDEDVQRA